MVASGGRRTLGGLRPFLDAVRGRPKTFFMVWIARSVGSDMIVVNTDFVPGKEIEEALGLVRGSTIRAKHLGKDIMAGFRNITGGRLDEYVEMLAESREEALNEMLDEAEKLKADAVVNVRFMTSSVMGGAAEILAYGTAVKLK